MATNATNEVMDTSVIDTFFAHHIWANLKILDFCAALSEAQLATSEVGGYGTIRETLHHMMLAEISYVARVTNQYPSHLIKDDQPTSFEKMHAVAAWTGEELLRLAQATRATSMVVEESPDERVEYSLASLIVQAITHATEHRAQINTIITRLGLEPPDVSLWYYLEEIGEFKITNK